MGLSSKLEELTNDCGASEQPHESFLLVLDQLGINASDVCAGADEQGCDDHHVVEVENGQHPLWFQETPKQPRRNF